MSRIDVTVPTISDIDTIEVIEVLVSVGNVISTDQSIMTFKSEKLLMEITSSATGTVVSINIAAGNNISKGDIMLTVETLKDLTMISPIIDDKFGTTFDLTPRTITFPAQVSASINADIHAEVLVLGSGPGGYTAAFRASDLGKKVVMIERHEYIGGVCLNVGCIPSKSLLHMAKIINEAANLCSHGIEFSKPQINLEKIRNWKMSIVNKLISGLKSLAKQRAVNIVKGEFKFLSVNSVQIKTGAGAQIISFDDCIIAAGSSVIKMPFSLNNDSRMMDSTDALALSDVPENLLVIGGGIIGLEMATVYNTLGSKITIVEMSGNLISGADKEIVKPLLRKLTSQYEAIYLNTKVSKIESRKEGLKVWLEGNGIPKVLIFDKILVAVGRVPNGKLINAEVANINVDAQGFINVNAQMQTNVPHIYAIGDIVGSPMLAHKAVHEAKVAAEVITGMKSAFNPMTIPSVSYTDPEVAWMGLSEAEAKEQNIDYVKGAFPWAASGRSLSFGYKEGLTKALFEKETGKIIGAGIVGPNAGELISEAVLALEMGANAKDLSLSIHPHPTLSETVSFSAQMADGSITELLPPRKILHHK